MAAIDLTVSQETLLQTLVDLHDESEEPVKGARIADRIDRDPGTVRNHMQSLKALQLVQGIPGPKGGYRPTVDAYDVLDVQQMDHSTTVPVSVDDTRVETVTVTEIDLTSVHHPEQCQAEITVDGSTAPFDAGATLTVGPTPSSNLLVRGAISGIDDTQNSLVVTVSDLRAPATDHDAFDR